MSLVGEEGELSKAPVAHVARLMYHPRIDARLSQSFAAHVSEEVFLAIPVDVATPDQTLELFRLQLLPGDLPLQLSDDLFHAAIRLLNGSDFP
jgi:hypothetical protein